MKEQKTMNSATVATFRLFRSILFILSVLEVLEVQSSRALAIDPDFDAVINKTITEQMSSLHIPGAIVTVVQDGRVTFAKGFGFADLENKVPMDPMKTMLSISSTSKSFTATAVMQLVEKGTLNIDQDITDYLTAFQIKSNHGQPISLRNVLTHTAGFDERNIGTSARSLSEVVPLADYLQRRMPPSLTPPGQMAVYSNHGYALAGYIVQRMSGLSFSDYVEQNIFKPLQMANSTWTPRQTNTKEKRAIGYSYSNGNYRPVPEIFYNIGPACAMVSTAEDMSHFMIAHLQGGRYLDQRILSESSTREMHRPQFSHHPLLPGVCFGFYERWQGDWHTITQGGNWQDGGNIMLLLPESNAGLFLFYNNQEGDEIENAVVNVFLKQFPANNHPELKPSNNVATDPSIKGTYRESRYSRTTIEKLGLLTGAISESEIAAPNDGNIRAFSHNYAPVQENVFKQTDGERILIFQPPTSNIPARVATSAGPFSVNERVPLFLTTKSQGLVGGICILIFISSLLASAARYIWRAISRKSTREIVLEIDLQKSQFARLAAYGQTSICALFLVFAFGMVLELALTDPWEFQYGVPAAIPALLGLAFVPIFLTLLMTVGLVLVWKYNYWTFSRRLHHTLIIVAANGFVFFMYNWNLIGFHY
jgi:CubicO group peptidase (beta-lactamase class C family)